MSGGRVTPSIPDGKEHDCAVSEVAREALVSSPPHRDGARSVDVCLCARRLRIRMGFLCSIRSHAHTRTHTHTHTHTHTLYRRRCGRSVRLAQRLPTLPKALHTHPSPHTHIHTHARAQRKALVSAVCTNRTRFSRMRHATQRFLQQWTSLVQTSVHVPHNSWFLLLKSLCCVGAPRSLQESRAVLYHACVTLSRACVTPRFLHQAPETALSR